MTKCTINYVCLLYTMFLIWARLPSHLSPERGLSGEGEHRKHHVLIASFHDRFSVTSYQVKSIKNCTSHTEVTHNLAVGSRLFIMFYSESFKHCNHSTQNVIIMDNSINYVHIRHAPHYIIATTSMLPVPWQAAPHYIIATTSTSGMLHITLQQLLQHQACSTLYYSNYFHAPFPYD